MSIDRRSKELTRELVTILIRIWRCWLNSSKACGTAQNISFQLTLRLDAAKTISWIKHSLFRMEKYSLLSHKRGIVIRAVCCIFEYEWAHISQTIKPFWRRSCFLRKVRLSFYEINRGIKKITARYLHFLHKTDVQKGPPEIKSQLRNCQWW